MLIGSIVDMLAIFVGCAIGLSIKWVAGRFSSRLSNRFEGLGDRLQVLVMQGLSLCTAYMGISGTLKGENTLIAIISIVIGAMVGETLDLDKRLNQLGDKIQEKMSRFSAARNSNISEAFVTTSLLYCVGAMAIMGALNSGLTGDHEMLFAKAVLDGTASIIFSMSLGIGVALSGLAVLAYQGVITLAASFLAPFLSATVIAEMTCVGSLLIIAISFNMLGITKIKAMNLLPALIPPIFLCQIM